MRFWFIILPNLSVNAMAIFPFILLKDKAQKKDAVLINHERIHLKQQLELLIIPFYFLYLINYLFNLVKYKNHHKAYFNISFEKEAYYFEKDLTYLTNRTWYNWINFYSA
ncbi:hypothetical protein FA048_03650 [Pedobacter polaris]|uniref:DUF4157 domain-containing protein n=1 Tax=Pedobacter polaris TaxID=2571273 RepID=A0A4U1CUZ8_9SPHI|nr:hypothetical protein [Pedobacter polaris]TKC12724.1 hypothetical protein FA048_03650 [Pedobacter polaris]